MGILGVDSDLDGDAVEADLFLAKVENPALGNEDLMPYDIHPGDHICNRVFDLQAGIHFQKPEFPGLRIDEKLDSSCIDIAGFPGHRNGRLVHGFSNVGRKVCRRNLQEFLMTSLY